MNVLIAFGTIEGHSRKIAERIGERIRELGHSCRIIDVSDLHGDLDLGHYNAVLVIAPVHQRAHPEPVIDFLLGHRQTLNAMPSALVSVSLSAAFDDGQAEAQSYVDHVLEIVGWQPTATHLAAGALRYDEYDYFKEQIIRHVVLKGRGGADVKGDHDFTAWDALTRFVDDFLEAANR